MAAAVFCGVAWGQAPTYSAAGIVNASDFSPGPFAPNSVLTLFGANLSWTSATAAKAGTLPTQLGNVSVYVNNQPAPLLFVSAGQINFLVPSNETPHDSAVRVVRQGVTGAPVTITLVSAAPALFVMADRYAIAQNAAYQLLVADAPAHPGDTVVLYATGLGPTQPNPSPGEILATAASIVNPAALQIQLAGVAIDPSLIKYAGLTPGFPGLYQLNFISPAGVPPDPEVRVVLSGQTSAPGLKLPVH